MHFIKHLTVIFLLFILFTFNVYAAETEEKDNATDLTEQKNALDYINTFRNQAKLPLFQLNKELDKSVQNHSEYMKTYKKFTHEQDKNKALFTGVYPWDRASYFNYKNPYVAEYIDQKLNTYIEGMIKFIDNPYARLSWLNPIYTDLAMSMSGDYVVYQIGGKNIEKKYEVLYPFENQQNIPIAWNNIYDPNPTRNQYKEYNITGTPITYSYYTDEEIQKIEVNSVTILNKNKNKKVDYILKTPQNDDYLVYSIIIIPKEKYDVDTEYEVNVDLSVRFKNFTRENIKKKWSFTTEEEAANPYFALQKEYLSDKENPFQVENRITRQQFVELLVSAMESPLVRVKYEIFTDVDKESTYAQYINTAYEENLINGYEDHTFKPNKYITREEMVVMLMRMYDVLEEKDYQKTTMVNSSIFKDFSECGTWSRKAVQAAYNLDIIKGKSNKMLDPKEFATKQEAMLVTERLMNQLEKNKN